MTWTRTARKPLGSRDGPHPLAAAAFTNEHGCRIQIYLMPCHPMYTMRHLQPGFTIEWSYKEPGKAWIRNEDPFSPWPTELASELVALIQEVAQKASSGVG